MGCDDYSWHPDSINYLRKVMAGKHRKEDQPKREVGQHRRVISEEERKKATQKKEEDDKDKK